MPKQKGVESEALVLGSSKIRKRGSPSSSSSSILQNYRFKRAIFVGKAARGSRSSTPVPLWRTDAADSSKYESIGGRTSRPVSARKLAATLWEMNEVPMPCVAENAEKRRLKSSGKMGLMPPHLSEPSHSPVCERRSGSGSHHKRTPSWLRDGDRCSSILDSLNSISLMEVETKTRHIPSRHEVSMRIRLKDVSSALTTSKELLKIVSHIWARSDQPSSSLSLISALHAELERAHLQVSQLIGEHHSEQKEMTHLIKCFAEDKASWKSKEQLVVESAIESVASELERERKLRRRFESLNKKLGNELSDTKDSLMKAIKELEREKKARDILQQVCDDLAGDIGEDKAKLRVNDMLREDRVQMKLLEPKNLLDEKNIAVDKLKNQVEALIETKRGKDEGHSPLKRTHFSSHQKESDGEVENGGVSEEGSGESDLHSIELSMENTKKSFKWANLHPARDNNRVSVTNEIKARNSSSSKPPRKSSPLLRSISNEVVWAEQSENICKLDEHLDRERLHELEKQSQVKSLLGRVSSSSRAGSVKDFNSPTRQLGSIQRILSQKDLVYRA